VRLEILAARNGEAFSRTEAAQGEVLADQSFLVVAGDALSLTLAPGENGLTLRSVKPLGATRAVVTATVGARGGAPDWLPTESTYLLFQGDRAAAAAVKDRYVPFEGMAAERSWPDQGGVTPLDRLAVAVGRSVARANAVLARTQAEAGVALVSRVTLRVGVRQTDLGQGRVFVALAGPGEEEAQYVELEMTTVPGAEPLPEREPGGGGGGQIISVRTPRTFNPSAS
jgi:hypothetical protein